MRAAVPIACLAAALLMAGRASAQATPRTPGPAGAEALAATAYAATLRGDWEAVGELLPPESLVLIESMSAEFAREIESVRAMPRSGPGALSPSDVVQAERLLAWADTASLLRGTPAETFGRVVSVPARTETAPRPAPAGVVYRLGGTTVVADTLIYVAGRLDASALGAGTLAVGIGARWTGTRWVLAASPADPDADAGETDPLAGALELAGEPWPLVFGEAVRRDAGVDL